MHVRTCLVCCMFDYTQKTEMYTKKVYRNKIYKVRYIKYTNLASSEIMSSSDMRKER